VLGAIVFIVAIKLVHLLDLKKIHGESPGEFWVATTTAAVVVLWGVEQGIILAMVMSLLRIVQHSYHPFTAVLVKEGEGGVWQLTPPVPGAISEPGLAIYRFGAPLFYANAGRFAEEIRGIVRPVPSPLRWILVDAGAITHVDYTAARVVRDLQKELAAGRVALVFARVGPELKPDLDRHHLTEAIGRDRIYDRLHHALAAYHKLVKAPPESPQSPACEL
jgi:MFS superfamily sulfate permease-like transporter